MKDRTLPNDPVGSGNPRGKARSQRKHRNDPGWTPTESRKRDNLMKQFCKLEGPSGNSEAYQASPAWCSGCNGRRLAVREGQCDNCWSTAHQGRVDDQLERAASDGVRFVK